VKEEKGKEGKGKTLWITPPQKNFLATPLQKYEAITS